MTELLDPVVDAARYAISASGAIDSKTIVVTVEPIAVDAKTACRMVNLSMPVLRVAMTKGLLNARMSGTKPLFEVAELRRWISTLPSWEPK
jgi:hypothetical protein